MFDGIHLEIILQNRVFTEANMFSLFYTWMLSTSKIKLKTNNNGVVLGFALRFFKLSNSFTYMLQTLPLVIYSCVCEQQQIQTAELVEETNDRNKARNPLISVSNREKELSHLGIWLVIRFPDRITVLCDYLG